MVNVLPVTLTGHDKSGETLREAADTSVEAVNRWLRNGGLATYFRGGMGDLHGYDVENVLILARLFLNEHPDWPEE